MAPAFQSGANLLQNEGRYYNVCFKALLQIRELLESGAGSLLLRVIVPTTKWGSYQKVGQYIDHRFINKESVRKIFCLPPMGHSSHLST